MLGKFSLILWAGMALLWWATTEPADRPGKLFAMGVAGLIVLAAVLAVRWVWKWLFPKC